MTRRADDVWASGDGYEPYIGRWSRLVAREFLDWLAAPPGARWLDLGCGTGALASTILARTAPARVHAVDPSLAYLRFAREGLDDPRVAFVAADGRLLPEPDGSADFAVSALALNFVPEPALALAEMARVVRGGGTVALYVWDYADGMQVIRRFWDAARALDSAASELDEATRFPICRAPSLEAVVRSAGLEFVETRAIDVPARFRNFADYWDPFLGGQGPAPGYVTGLSAARRAALREHLRETLPIEPDGSFVLTARAWAVRGEG